jgi:hypothetical protein
MSPSARLLATTSPRSSNPRPRGLGHERTSDQQDDVRFTPESWCKKKGPLRTSGHSTVLLNLRAPNFDDIPQNRADEIRVIGNYFELSN